MAAQDRGDEARTDSDSEGRSGRVAPRRIVGILAYLGPGGAQKALVRLKRQLVQRGHDMEVWAFHRRSDLFDDEPGVRVILPVERAWPLAYLMIVVRLFRLLRRHRPDAVITFMPSACLLGQVVARLVGVRQRIASQRNPSGFRRTSLRLSEAIIGSTGFYTANVAVSNSVLDSFERYPASYRRLLTCIHNGIEWQSSRLSVEEARARFGFDEDAFVVLAVGRFHRQKNYAFLFRILAEIEEARLVIAGDGPLRGELEALADSIGLRPRLDLLGLVPGSDIPDLLRAADLFVQPSIYEGQSNSLLEAMHEGLPILTSDAPSQVETLRGDEGMDAGLLLPTTDQDLWVRSIRSLIEDAPGREALGRRAQERAKDFTLERSVDRFEKLLDR